MPSYESSTTRLDPHDRSRCALIQDLLPLYLEGEVSPTSRALIAEHLSDCSHCAGFLAGARHVWAQVHRKEAQRTRTVVRDAEAQQTVAAWRQWLTLVPTVLVALVLAGLVTVTILGFAHVVQASSWTPTIYRGTLLPEFLGALGLISLVAFFYHRNAGAVAAESSSPLFTAAAVLTLCAAGAFGSLVLIGGLQGRNPLALSLGLPIVPLSFMMLVALARKHVPLTSLRLLGLTGSCVMGAISAYILFAGHTFRPHGAILIGLASLVGIWLTVWQVEQPPGEKASASPIDPRDQQLTVMGLLVAMMPLAVLVTDMTSQTSSSSLLLIALSAMLFAAIVGVGKALLR
jgi:hypothetical protein